MSGSYGAFVDDTTKREIGFVEVWQMFQPVSKAGVRHKREVRAYRPSERLQWQEAMQDLAAVCRAAEDAGWRKELLDRLRDLPDVGAVLPLLRSRSPMRVVDFFEVKSFLWRARETERLLESGGVSLSWWKVLDWESLLRMLNAPGELVPTFSLDDLEDAELMSLRQEYGRLDGLIYSMKKEQGERLRMRYGRAPSRDGQYSWEKSQREKLAVAAQDDELLLVQENVFEAVYQVNEPAEVAAWKAEKEQTKQAMEDREVIVLQALVEAFHPHADALEDAMQALAKLDWTLAKSVVAFEWKVHVEASVWIGEEMTGQDSVSDTVGMAVEGDSSEMASVAGATNAMDVADVAWRVVGAWHPTVRQAVEKRGGTYTSLDMELRPGVGLITGPNMGGKTIVLKTFGLLQALAQYAMPVPASAFHFHPVERVGLSGGDEQNMASGLSSFGGEMLRLAELLKSGGRSLLLLDEVARTTNPEEGEALAIGLAEYLLESLHTALLASHFPGVTSVAGIQGFRVAGLREDVLEKWEQEHPGDEVLERLQHAMDYRLLPSVGTDIPKQAVRLARCFGLPDGVLARTQAILQIESRERLIAHDPKGGGFPR